MLRSRATPHGLPARGDAVRELGLPLPGPGLPAAGAGGPRMPLLHAGRPLKRWRYMAAFGPELMLCAGDARIGPLPQRWWAIAEPGVPLRERTSIRSAGLTIGADQATGHIRVQVSGPAVRLNLRIDAGEAAARPIEVVSPTTAGDWIWTRKQAGLPAHGYVELRGRRREVELVAVIDDSAGYHNRRTAWRWSTGVGWARSGERVAWNLVDGVHDAPAVSERTVWVEGQPAEVGEASFADDLSAVAISGGGRLAFTPWAVREHSMNVLLIRSRYRQPFGTFSGELPGGLTLDEGYGVMEEHDVLW